MDRGSTCRRIPCGQEVVAKSEELDDVNGIDGINTSYAGRPPCTTVYAIDVIELLGLCNDLLPTRYTPTGRSADPNNRRCPPIVTLTYTQITVHTLRHKLLCIYVYSVNLSARPYTGLTNSNGSNTPDFDLPRQLWSVVNRFRKRDKVSMQLSAYADGELQRQTDARVINHRR